MNNRYRYGFDKLVKRSMKVGRKTADNAVDRNNDKKIS